MNVIDEWDADSVALRLLCEKAQERLERTWAAVDYAARAIQLPDGSWVWAKEGPPAAP
jgi:hypothetical protein